MALLAKLGERPDVWLGGDGSSAYESGENKRHVLSTSKVDPGDEGRISIKVAMDHIQSYHKHHHAVIVERTRGTFAADCRTVVSSTCCFVICSTTASILL